MTEDERCGTDLERAIAILHSGGVIGFPTETVYGLAADARDVEAIGRIFRVKGRPIDHPLIVHVPDLAAARAWSADWPPSAEILARTLWPGPLTLIVRLKASMDGPSAQAITGGRSTVALRVPSHPLAQQLLQHFPGGVAAPSANRFGRVSPTTARHVLDDLGLDVDYVLDGGPCAVGLESTIVDCSVSPPQILRHGSITLERIEAAVGPVATPSGPARAPGMMVSHYAPRCRVRPVADLDEANRLGEKCTGPWRVLDGATDPDVFAHDLYALLRLCDDDGIEDAFVIVPAESEIGRAVRDRVFKAAADHRER
ncbi:MAG: L-threonylcarbamoyladenylate synthase [Ilumatobacteraceae bacterium]